MTQSAEQLFVQVVQAGSFKQAAEQLELEPSSVSRKIAALEQRLQVQLLHRSTRRTRPTELGQRYYEGLSRLLDEHAALESELSRASTKLTGLVRISAPADFGAEFVVPAVRALQTNAPELSVELLLGSQFVDLVEQGIDVAVRIGELVDSNLIAVRLGEARRVLVAAPTYLRRHGIPRSPEDLSRHEFVFYTPRQARSDIRFADGSRVRHGELHGRVTVNNVRSIRELVVSGAGLHLGPRWAFQGELAAGTVREVLPDFPLQSFPVHAVYPARAFLPSKTRAFVDAMREALAGRL